MQQITEWLAGLGLGQYAEVFNENGIDFSVLPDLTDQDFKELGVLLGHPRKLLRSIANLKGVESVPPSVQVAPAPTAPRPLDSAERGQVTVIFADLVGSTALSARMDPEDLREVISAYQKCVAETVRRFNGFVAKDMGDGVLARFGYPVVPHSPVLMILEDTHWADPTSLEVFGRVVARIPTLRVLLIVTFRPEFAPPWNGQPHAMAMTINRLSQRDVDAIIDGVVGNKRLSPNIRQDIIERSDGIPLFVEEMTKAVLEAESEGAAQRTVAAVPSPRAYMRR